MRSLPPRMVQAALLLALGAAAIPALAEDDLSTQNSGPNKARAAGAAAATPADDGSQPAAPPAEAQPAEAQPGEAAPPPEGQPGTVGVPGGKASAEATAATLDVYTIQQGDTLWDICAKMLGDPFFWPKLWTFNQYITNPHWIYPGNQLHFRAGTETAPPSFEVTKAPEPVAAATAAPESTPVAPAATSPAVDDAVQEGGGVAAGPQPTPIQVAAVPQDFLQIPPKVDEGSFQINLRQEGFIAEREIPPIGRVYKSDLEKQNLVEGDSLYLKFNDPSQVTVGKRYTVFRTLHKVTHPRTHGYLGFLVKILAHLEVTSLEGSVATAKIVDSFDYVNRGDPITDYVDVVKRVAVAPNASSMEGYVVESMADMPLMARGDVLYIDKGQDDGVKIGNTLDVVELGDGLARPFDNDRSLPNQVVGRLVIVGTRSHTSTAVVVDSYSELPIGGRVRMVQN